MDIDSYEQMLRDLAASASQPTAGPADITHEHPVLPVSVDTKEQEVIQHKEHANIQHDGTHVDKAPKLGGPSDRILTDGTEPGGTLPAAAPINTMTTPPTPAATKAGGRMLIKYQNL